LIFLFEFLKEFKLKSKRLLLIKEDFSKTWFFSGLNFNPTNQWVTVCFFWLASVSVYVG
jgi:hypothetical protein